MRKLSKKAQAKYDKILEEKGQEAANEWLKEYETDLVINSDLNYLRQRGAGLEGERDPIKFFYGSSNIFREEHKTRRDQEEEI